MRYISVSESLRQNGDRHAERAAVHLAAGRVDYAAGSMRKAKRNWERAKLWDAPAWTAKLVENFARQVAERVLYGR